MWERKERAMRDSKDYSLTSELFMTILSLTPKVPGTSVWSPYSPDIPRKKRAAGGAQYRVYSMTPI